MRKRGTLNVAMIEYGFMGRAHSNAFRQASTFFDTAFDLRLKVICGRNEDKVGRTAAAWGWQETARHWESVVARPDIDVIDICAPNYLHAPIAIAAAKAGKIILCEKPLANSAEEAEQMTEAARGRNTLVWFNYRRVPAVRYARDLVQQERIGDVFHYRALYLQSWGRSPGDPAAWRFKPDQAGSGGIGDLLSHSLDLALWLNGPICRLCANVQVFEQGRKVDDAVSMLAEFASGSMGTFEATRFAMGNQNRNSFEINGSRGALAFNLEKMNHLQYNDLREDGPVQGTREIFLTGPGHPYVDQCWPPGHVIGYEHTFIATVVDFLHALERGERFRPDFADALEVQRLLDLVTESSRRGGWLQAAQLQPVQ